MASALKKFEADLVTPPVKRKMHMRGLNNAIDTVEVTVRHVDDPKEDIFKRLGLLPPEVVQFSKVLVAIYKAPVVTKSDGGLVLPFSMSDYDEDEFIAQGKVGLVVAKGPQAYKDDENVKFHGTENHIGDWVWFRPSDGMPVQINGVMCRLFSEPHILGRLPHPDFLW